jgi:hypothetical protein
VCTGTYSLGETSQAQVPPIRTKESTGTYSLGETSQAQVPPIRTKGLETPPSRSHALGVTTPPKSPSKSPTKSWFTTLVLGIANSVDAEKVAAEAIPTEVI